MSGSGHSQAGESTSRSLLKRAKEHDPESWRRLTAVYGPLVYEWCRRAGLQSNDAADVIQEVFQSVAHALHRFRKERPQDTFRGWLLTITRNKIRDHFRDKVGQPEAMGGSAAQFRMQQIPNAVDGVLTDECLHSMLARRAVALMQTDFEEHTWQAFWLTAVEQQPAASVAKQLGISRAAVYVAKSRVLRRLREELDGLDLVE